MPVVPIVCDLNIYLCPDLMPKGTRTSYGLWFKSDVLKADRIVAISQGTSDRLKRILGRAADAIVLPAVSDLYQPPTTAALESVREKYDLGGPYIVFVGTLEPRKNLSTLIAAHQAVNKHRADAVTLVLVGKRGWNNKPLIEMLDGGIPHVRELGYIPESDLPPLYAGADAFVMPSTYEGYGMPAAEARACGALVVATDIPELREAAGDAAIFVDPTVEGLTKGIEQALTLPRPAASRSQSWDDSARILARVLRQARRA
ncbi:MAG: glycosyltransferase family 1 protein [Gemmatimonadaceae bacterium]